MCDLISVIVPVYNAETTIEKCLNSLVAEDFQNAEWYSVRWSDAVYYIPTLFNIAECIEEYD